MSFVVGWFLRYLMTLSQTDRLCSVGSDERMSMYYEVERLE
jgi:hypothetical protein